MGKLVWILSFHFPPSHLQGFHLILSCSLTVDGGDLLFGMMYCRCLNEIVVSFVKFGHSDNFLLFLGHRGLSLPPEVFPNITDLQTEHSCSQEEFVSELSASLVSGLSCLFLALVILCLPLTSSELSPVK